jgi:hypothetical protein
MPFDCGHAAAAEARYWKEEVDRVMPFSCAICAEESTAICARCTQDTCRNHLCEKCRRCSDCCECEVLLEERGHEPQQMPVRAAHAAPAPGYLPESDEEAWEPPSDPDPIPPEDPEPGPVAP